MIRAAADDVRFLLFIYHKMVQKLNDKSLWRLAVRGALYCRCFCINDNDFADWPPLPPIPGYFSPVSLCIDWSCLTLKSEFVHIYLNGFIFWQYKNILGYVTYVLSFSVVPFHYSKIK